MLLKGVLIFVHIVVSVFLILVVLLQTGKRADLAGAFGGGGSQTAFGARGAATVLSKLTTTFAVVFMLTSLSLAILSATGPQGGSSALDELDAAEQSAPVTQDAAPVESVPADAAPAPADADPATSDGDDAGESNP